MYMAVVLTWFFIGTIIGLLMRTNLMSVTSKLMGAQTYNAAFTLHGVIMIFLFIIPVMPVISARAMAGNVLIIRNRNGSGQGNCPRRGEKGTPHLSNVILSTSIINFIYFFFVI